MNSHNTKPNQKRTQSKQELISSLQGIEADLQGFGVTKLGIFGSFQRGDQSSESDIDILVKFREGEKTFDNYMNLHDLLSDVTDREIELVTTESLSAHIGPHILKTVEYVPFSN